MRVARPQMLAILLLAIGVLLVAQAIGYAVVQFYFSDTWELIVWTAVGTALALAGAISITTRKRIRDVADIPYPNSAIWRQLSDPEVMGRTWSQRASTEVIERDDAGHAVRWLARVKTGRIVLVFEWRYEERDPPFKISYKSEAGASVVYVLEPAPSGTRVRRTEVVRTNLLLRALSGATIPVYKRKVRRHFKRLRQNLDAEAAGIS